MSLAAGGWKGGEDHRLAAKLSLPPGKLVGGVVNRQRKTPRKCRKDPLPESVETCDFLLVFQRHAVDHAETYVLRT